MNEIHATIIVIVEMSTLGSINRELKVVHSNAVSVSVAVSEETGLKHLIIGVVDTRDDVGWVHGELLVLSKEIVDVPVEDQATNWLQRDEVLGPDSSGVEYVKVELVLIRRVKSLDVELPLGVVSSGNGLVEVLGSVAVVGASDPDGVFLQQTLDSASGLPVELHKGRFPSLVDQSEGVNPETLHVPVVYRNTHVVEQPGEGEHALGVEGQEVQHPPILLDVGLWVGLESVDHIRELDSIADEEHGEVVSHNVKVTLSTQNFSPLPPKSQS